jgi:glycosyltransferase involved in cell wall biosynthesis
VTPRYGREVGGGAETLAREYATRLAAVMDVTVLTTCALDYRTWQDHFAPGQCDEDGVRVVRFPVSAPRDGRAFDRLSARVFGNASPDRTLQERWMDAQGPNAPGLLAALADRGDQYDAVCFIPYLYATTFRGLPLVADRAILVPAFHDEPPLRLSLFDDLVSAARALVFSTPEELELAGRRFAVDPARCHLVGAGIDPPPPSDPGRFRSRFGIDRPYVVCLGRIDPSKGSLALIADHREYRRRRSDGLDLVMVGPAVKQPSPEPWLHLTGYVTEEQKHDVLAGATALVCPSPYESLSLVLLEAWSHGVPTIVTSASPVLRGQAMRAGAGIWYRDAAEYGACLDLLSHLPPLARALGRAGQHFTGRLRWPAVIGNLEAVLRQAAGRPPRSATAPAGAGSPDGGRDGVVRHAPREPGPLQVACLADDAERVAAALRSASAATQLYVFTADPRAPLPRGVVAIRRDGFDAVDRLEEMDVVVDDALLVDFGQIAERAGAIVTTADAERLGAAIHAAATAQIG